MEKLEARFDAVQEKILDLYEQGSDQLEDQIKYWELVRHEGAIEFCARKQGFNKLGMHTVPSSIGAESKAKSAIAMQMRLKSLLESQYGSLPWTLQDTSLEMVKRTEPEGMLKKHGHSVEVLYDDTEDNLVSYMVWGDLYGQDEEGQWQHYHSDVDYYGVYFTDMCGDKVYYEKFDVDSQRFGQLGRWTVKYKQKTFTSCPDSSSSKEANLPEQPTRKRKRSWKDTTEPETPVRATDLHTPRSPRHPASCKPGGRGLREQHRRRQQQGERASPQRPSPEAWPTVEEARRRPEGPSGSCGPSDQRILPDSGHSPIILVKGPTNALKCWRNRLRRRPFRPFTSISTAFSWVGDSGGDGIGNMLIGFSDTSQREFFISSVPLPRGSIYHRGSLDGL